MQKRVILIVILLVTALPRALAQEPTAWQGLSFLMPDGWTSEEFDGRLYVGTPEDIATSREGNLPDGLLLTIAWHPGQTSDFDVSRRSDDTDLMLQTDYENVAQILSGQVVGWVVLLPPGYLLTATAPDFIDAIPTLDAFLASIEIGNAHPAETLPQSVQLRNLRFNMPADWQLLTTGTPNLYVLQSNQDRLEFAATFRITALMVTIRDLSPIRPMITSESIRTVDGGFYRLSESAQSAELSIGNESDVTVVRMPIGLGDTTSEDILGEALLFLTADHAYLVSGIAEAEAWEAGEGALWEAFKAMLEFVP